MKSSSLLVIAPRAYIPSSRIARTQSSDDLRHATHESASAKVKEKKSSPVYMYMV